MSTIEKAVERLTAQPAFHVQRPGFARVVLPLPGARAGMSANVGAEKPALSLDFVGLARMGYLTPANHANALLEEYQLVKRPLLVNANKRDGNQIEYGNLIAITSALPGEGKTFTTFNLAMSMVMERDITVLLVDCDLIRRSLSELVGLHDAPGLADVLLTPDEINLEDVIVTTNVPRLKLLPAGSIHPNVTELVASERMRQITHEISLRYPDRIVLLDAPPLLTTSQATVLAPLVGQVVIVVQEGKTSRQAITEAVASFDKTNKIVGFVINKSTHGTSREYRRGYYYGAPAR